MNFLVSLTEASGTWSIV